MKFLKQLFCKHTLATMIYSFKAYDEETWVECSKCGKYIGEVWYEKIHVPWWNS